MDNPWLRIPVSDYEGHMAAPEVGQLPHLSDVFQEMLARFRPNSIAVLGAAAGNGFEHIPGEMRSVSAIDINPGYLDVLRERHATRLPGLEMICADVARSDLDLADVELVHAALFFEYVDPRVVLKKIVGWMSPGGVLCALLQLPSETSAPVSETGYKSLESLPPILQHVDPET